MHLRPEIINLIAESMLAYSQKVGDPVPDPRWDKYKEDLLKLNSDDEFYTLYDLKTDRIIWHHGIDKWLGYLEPDKFDVLGMSKLVHPFVYPFYEAFGIGMDTVIVNHEGILEFMNPRYSINIPVRKANGEYVSVKQISYPIHFDKNNCMVTHFNKHRINGIYTGQPLETSISIGDEKQEHLMPIIFKAVTEIMDYTHTKYAFTRDELRLLDAAYQVRHETKRNELLSKQFYRDIRNLNTSIVAKTKWMFQIDKIKAMPAENTPLSNFHTCLPKLGDIYDISAFLIHSRIKPVLDMKLKESLY
ncbi:MAG: hypothetical protein JNL70_26610 [Saprospiraceae bacterium]|nr:hypothetical protein [Saprospiraceae bacterium]